MAIYGNNLTIYKRRRIRLRKPITRLANRFGVTAYHLDALPLTPRIPYHLCRDHVFPPRVTKVMTTGETLVAHCLKHCPPNGFYLQTKAPSAETST